MGHTGHFILRGKPRLSGNGVYTKHIGLSWLTKHVCEHPLCFIFFVDDMHNFIFCCCLVIKSCPTLCDPMDQSTTGPPVFHYLPQLGQIQVGHFGDTVQESRPLWSPSPLAFTLSQHQGLFQGLLSSHEMAKVLEPQLQDQSFQ